MENWTLNQHLVYVFVCVSSLGDGKIDTSEKEAWWGNCNVIVPDMSKDEYSKVVTEVSDKFEKLGDEDARKAQYTNSLEALKGIFTSDNDRFKLIKNLAYIVRADKVTKDKEKEMVEEALKVLDMTDKVDLSIQSILYVNFKG